MGDMENTSHIMMEGQGYGAVSGMVEFDADMEGSVPGGAQDSIG